MTNKDGSICWPGMIWRSVLVAAILLLLFSMLKDAYVVKSCPNWYRTYLPIALKDAVFGVSTPTPAPTPTPKPTPTSVPLGNMVGAVYTLPLNEPFARVGVSLAKIICDGEPPVCIWILSIPGSPSAWTAEDGTFEFTDIPAGPYLVILGNIQLSGSPCDDDACDFAGVWFVEPGETTNTGILYTWKDLLVCPIEICLPTASFYFSGLVSDLSLSH